MRSAFAQALLDLAAEDERIVLLTGDLGFAVLEPFAERFPDRFWNVGVAEQNMVGLATGLAEAGHTPYVYSIATFASMRGYEFVRNGPILHELPVRVVGVGGGMDYGHNGVTHYALEDAGIMRVQPGIAVIAPADPEQTCAALPAIQDLPGPAYLRLGKESQAVPGLDGRFTLGRAERIGDGRDLALVALGGMAASAVEAAERLAADGVDASVLVVSSLNPARPRTSPRRSRTCRLRSAPRPTTSTAPSARSSPRRSPSTGWDAGSCASACAPCRSAPPAAARIFTSATGSRPISSPPPPCGRSTAQPPRLPYQRRNEPESRELP